MVKKLHTKFVYICRRLYDFVWHMFRLVRYRRKNVQWEAPSIISQNCIGGCMYHDLGLPFLSPTINCCMNFKDFVKFCERLNFYLSFQLVDAKIDSAYPAGKLHDIIIHFVHYKSFEEAKQKWDIRKNRLDFNNVRIIATDRDGCNTDLTKRFLKLPYKKVLFSHFASSHPDIVYIEGYEKDGQVGIINAKEN